jgi:redox-sensitive bicupin YhaK (pirin superfamily)
MYDSVIIPGFIGVQPLQHFPAESFPTIHPVPWLHSHFAVGGWSPLQRLSGMLTAHMTAIAPHNGFTWHPHRGLEIYTWVLDGTVYHEDTTGGRGIIQAGELQRMFSGQWIEHQELNRTSEPARVIQIWFVADYAYRDTPPHYQQLAGEDLPSRVSDGVKTYCLIGDDSPMEQHVSGRLTATMLQPAKKTQLESPRVGEDLFVYVTDGQGSVRENGRTIPLGQYDVLLASREAGQPEIVAASDSHLNYLNFYLPRFMN